MKGPRKVEGSHKMEGLIVLLRYQVSGSEGVATFPPSPFPPSPASYQDLAVGGRGPRNVRRRHRGFVEGGVKTLYLWFYIF